MRTSTRMLAGPLVWALSCSPGGDAASTGSTSTSGDATGPGSETTSTTATSGDIFPTTGAQETGDTSRTTGHGESTGESTDVATDGTTSGTTGEPAEPRIPGVFVAVGASYERISSRDGIVWENHAILEDPKGDVDILRDVAYGEGMFVTVNQNTRIFRSTDDAKTWEEVAGVLVAGSATKPNTWKDVGWLGGMVFAGGSFHGAGASKIVRSDDGQTWALDYRGGTGGFRTMGYGDGTWLAAGDEGRISISTDGETWQEIQHSGAGYQGAAYGMGMLMLVGHAGRVTIRRDSTGELEDLVVPGLDLDAPPSFRGVAYGEGKFYLGGDKVAAVYDGVNWGVQPELDKYVGRVAFGVDPDGDPVIVGAWGSTISRSTDGLEWTTTFSEGVGFRSVRFAPTGDP